MITDHLKRHLTLLKAYLFDPVPSGKGLFAIEKMTLIYCLLTSILILFLFMEMGNPVGLIFDRLLIVGMTFVLMYLYRLAPSRFSAFVRMVVQMSLLAYWYPDTFEFNRLFPNLDHYFAATEHTLFGGQPSLWFSAAFPHMWVSEPLNMGYFFYYPMILIVVLWYLMRRFSLLEKVSFVILTGFFIYYLIYIFLPVAGPQFYFPAIGMDSVAQGSFPAIGDFFNGHCELLPAPGYEHGFFYKMVEASQQVGERPTAAFPSSHVGMSTILMIMAWRGSRRLFAALFPFYVLLCCATVYIQAHYLIDALAGFITAFPVYMLATLIYKKWFEHPVFRCSNYNSQT